MGQTPFTGSLEAAARLTAAFYAWEMRGRGWSVWDAPVELEPPLGRLGPTDAPTPIPDDGRTPSAIGAWFSGLFGTSGVPPAPRDEDAEDEEVPTLASAYPQSVLRIALAPDVKVGVETAERFLLSLSTTHAPIAFEVVGTSQAVMVQIACASRDAKQVQDQFRAYFPDAIVSEGGDFLADSWTASHDGSQIVVDFGLSQEFMRPLRTMKALDPDPLVAAIGAMADLSAGETGVLQVLFQPVRQNWTDAVLRSVTTWDGEAFFDDAPDLLPLAKEKVESPLLSVVVRVAASASSRDRALQIVQHVGGAFTQLASPTSNSLIALSNDDYPDDDHAADLVGRLSRRTGMVLSSAELVSLVHPPAPSVRAEKLARGHRRTKAAPVEATRGTYTLGTSVHGSISRSVSLTTEQRLRHVHIVGASGTGKSTLILNAIRQDMEQGNGLALIDPHGDLVEQVLSLVPEHRIKDVILVDPADTERPIGFNILSAHSDLEKTLLSSDLVAVFRRLSTSWGDQMTSVLSNAVLAFLESTRGGTLADLRRFLIEPEYRKEFLETVTDREVVYYWQKEFPLLAGRPQAPLLTRLDTFLRPKLVRAMMAQPENRLDFASIMNEGKILLVRLAQGAIGEENAALLGTLFVAKLHQLALGRQAVSESERKPFFVYLDEFQHFVTPSMATLLTGARKYRVGLVLAHQELRQLWNQERDVAGAVLANAATRICFRVGDDDAKKLEDGFTAFSARDLQNLGVGQAVCRVERAEWDFSLDTPLLPAISGDTARARRDAVAEMSRERYGVAPSYATPPEAMPPAPPPRPEARVAAPTAHTPVPSIAAPRTAGRGGSQHKYIQELVRRWASAHGWRADVEQPVLDGLGSVDVSLTNGERRVAVEISVTSTTDYELGNVQKCLAAGFESVVCVVTDKRALLRLRRTVADTLPAPDVDQVHVLNPEALFDYLNTLELPLTASTESHSRGYKVRVQTGSRSRMGAGRSQTLARTVIGALKRMGR